MAPWTIARLASLSMGFSKPEYWSGLPCPSPGIFLTQGSNSGLLHCRQILYHLSHRGSPFISRPTSNKTSSVKPVVEVLAVHRSAQWSVDTSTPALAQACASASPAATSLGDATSTLSLPVPRVPPLRTVSQFPRHRTACFPPLIWAYSQLPGIGSPLTTWAVLAAG